MTPFTGKEAALFEVPQSDVNWRLSEVETSVDLSSDEEAIARNQSIGPPGACGHLKFCHGCRCVFRAESWTSELCHVCLAEARERSAAEWGLKRRVIFSERFRRGLPP